MEGPQTGAQTGRGVSSEACSAMASLAEHKRSDAGKYVDVSWLGRVGPATGQIFSYVQI